MGGAPARAPRPVESVSLYRAPCRRRRRRRRTPAGATAAGLAVDCGAMASTPCPESAHRPRSSPLSIAPAVLAAACILASTAPATAAAAPAAVARPATPAAPATAAAPAAPAAGLHGAAPPALPYSPVLDPASMDRAVDPCVDFYAYSCGGWMKRNPIPPDQAGWSVFQKLHDENLTFLARVLETASQAGPARDPATAQIGDLYASCMDEAAIARAGAAPLREDLDAIAAIGAIGAIGATGSPGDPAALEALAEVVARLQLETGAAVLFDVGSNQDFKDSSQVIAVVAQGGLGLPDRDYYLATDARSAEIRTRYVAYVARMLQRLGEQPAAAEADARQVLALETSLARASISRVEERTPANVYHRFSRAQLQALVPKFPWDRYFAALQAPQAPGPHDPDAPRAPHAPGVPRAPHAPLAPGTAAGRADPKAASDLGDLNDLSDLNVAEPGFFSGLEMLLESRDPASWRAYLRWRLVDTRATQLSPDFENDHFDFYQRFLRGRQELPPRWRRCVQWVDEKLGEALGRVYVERAFSPDAKARSQKMVDEIEKAMDADLRQLPWMSAATRAEALHKLHAMTNKVGYPDHWRDYGSVRVERQDFAGNVARATLFESRRQLAKIGKPVDRQEWGMTPPTVNAYYNPFQNEINFPAGVLQPPLFDPRLDDAPNFGDTGGTIGHELTHGFDDEGRQFDYGGNLRDWWTPQDAREFEARTHCIEEQYGRYTIVDDVKINGKLTLGEDVADLGGLLLAYRAWREATSGLKLEPIDGLTPDQRFFVGYGQSWCSSRRPQEERLRAGVDPHSPPRFRTNGVVSNLPEFRQAFGCRTGQPMAPATMCRVW
jgi:putative endopeptidase